MNTKNFIIAGIVGGIVDFILGGFFYGVLFPDIYPETENPTNYLFIMLGCLTFGFLISYIFVKWAQITNFITGAKGGAIIGLLYGLSMNFFMHSSKIPDYNLLAIDTLLNVIMGAAVGGIVALVNGKMK